MDSADVRGPSYPSSTAFPDTDHPSRDSWSYLVLSPTTTDREHV